jgi:AraC family transcriptional regulator of adaptative response/methylated-DNA-[protein]-cysteine methyltransferase
MTKNAVSGTERDRMSELCRHIEAVCNESPSLDALAARAGMSPFHLQRRFKAVVGVSPKEYADACRLRAFKQGLRREKSVTSAVYDAGFNSSSRVYERAGAQLGMTPRQYRLGGGAQRISYAEAQTPLGPLMIAATDRGICFLQFGEDLQDALAREFPRAELAPMEPQARKLFDHWMKALNGYLAGALPVPDLPLDIRGTAFQQKVWKYLQTIPPGAPQSYTEVAKRIGRPRAVRAVAGACAANRIALVIPCHRVIRGDGGLAGYRWNTERKRFLLDLEAKTPRSKRGRP